MPFVFRNLDTVTRDLMVDEIESAIKENNLYFSKRFNSDGERAWPILLTEAARAFDEHWLAYQLEARQLMSGFETSRIPSGGRGNLSGSDPRNQLNERTNSLG